MIADPSFRGLQAHLVDYGTTMRTHADQDSIDRAMKRLAAVHDLPAAEAIAALREIATLCQSSLYLRVNIADLIARLAPPAARRPAATPAARAKRPPPRPRPRYARDHVTYWWDNI